MRGLLKKSLCLYNKIYIIYSVMLSYEKNKFSDYYIVFN